LNFEFSYSEDFKLDVNTRSTADLAELKFVCPRSREKKGDKEVPFESWKLLIYLFIYIGFQLLIFCFQFQVFWVVMPPIVVVGYQHFGWLCCLHLQGEGGGGMTLWWKHPQLWQERKSVIHQGSWLIMLVNYWQVPLKACISFPSHTTHPIRSCPC